MALRTWRAQQHLQNGRHAVGEGDLFFLDQAAKHVRLVAAGIYLLDPEHGGHVRHAPGMHVEHRGDRHVDIVVAHQADAVQAAHGGRHGHGVQHQLPMSEVHALGVTSGASGIEGRSHRVLIEIGEVIVRAGRSQQALVLANEVRQVGVLVFAIGQQQGFLHRGQLTGNTVVQRHELTVDQHETVFGMVHGVENLIRRQADVDGVQHRAEHGNGEHALQIAVAVPVHDSHGITGLDPRLAKHVGQARDTLVEGGVAVAQLVAIDDFAGFLVATAR